MPEPLQQVFYSTRYITQMQMLNLSGMLIDVRRQKATLELRSMDGVHHRGKTNRYHAGSGTDPVIEHTLYMWYLVSRWQRPTEQACPAPWQLGAPES